jgi:hypothetical protein
LAEIGLKKEEEYIVVVVNGIKEEIKVIHVKLETKHEVEGLKKVGILKKKANLNCITKLVQEYNPKYSKINILLLGSPINSPMCEITS